MLEQGLAGLLELLEARAVDLLGVVGPLRQGVAGDVVAAGDPGRVEARVVDAARGLVDPAAGDALEDDLEGGLERDGQVDGDDALEAAGLRGVAGVPVEDEGRRRVLGGLRGRGGASGGKGAECHAVAGLHLCGGGGGLGRERHNLGGSVALQPAAVAELAGYEAEHEVVGDEAAGLHGALGLDACADVNRSVGACFACWALLTERRPVLDIAAEQVAGADGRELGEPPQQSFALGALADAGSAYKNNSSGSSKLHLILRGAD